jgi:hypothetical protein
MQRGQLVCGVRGKHVVADYELKTMIDDIEMEDILSVYVVRAKHDPRWAGRENRTGVGLHDAWFLFIALWSRLPICHLWDTFPRSALQP